LIVNSDQPLANTYSLNSYSNPPKIYTNAAQIPKLILSALVVSLLIACGGGGSSNSITTPSPSSATRVLNESAFQNKVENYAVGDLNGDGLDDVVIGGWTGVAPGSYSYLAVLIQNTNGSLTDRTAQLAGTHIYPGSNRIFILDVDNDGFVDIWLPGFNDCTGCSAQSVMLWGSVNGIFTRQTFATAIDSHGARGYGVSQAKLPNLYRVCRHHPCNPLS
jgi:hypothetical protein